MSDDQNRLLERFDPPRNCRREQNFLCSREQVVYSVRVGRPNRKFQLKASSLSKWCLALTLPALTSAAPLFTHVDVFTSGAEGYHTFRIPALVTTPDGSLLAFTEGRKENRHDPGGGDIDLVYKRSTDQGATWSPLQVLDDPGERWGAADPVPLVDRTNGRVWIVYNRWEPGFGTMLSQPGTTNNQTWLSHSDDNGRTWSTPRDITRSTRDFDHWGAIFVGSGGAIQIRSGRLLVPAAMRPDFYEIWVSIGNYEGRVNFMRSYAIHSDDHGRTWQRGALVNAPTNENQLVELADGTIMMDARQSSGDHRWVMISSDGGRTWSQPRPGQSVTPVCTSIERYTLKAEGDDRNRILWTGPTGPGRKNLVVRVSYDEGQTFSNEKVIYGGIAAYSDISILQDQTVGVLWERGISETSQFITFTRFNREFLEAGTTHVAPAFP